MDDLLPSSIAGLSLHPLVVHATVVLVPLASLAVLLAAVLPRFRRWAGVLPVLLSAAALALTPVASSSGETFERQLESQGTQNPAIQSHAELGGLLIWWVVPLFVVALAAYVVSRRHRRSATVAGGTGTTGGGTTGGGTTGSTAVGSPTPRWLTVGLAVLGVVVPIGAIVQVVLIGHSGAEAVWGYLAS